MAVHFQGGFMAAVHFHVSWTQKIVDPVHALPILVDQVHHHALAFLTTYLAAIIALAYIEKCKQKKQSQLFCFYLLDHLIFLNY